MSFPVFPIERLWKKIFPFTWRGNFFFVLSLLIFVIGIIRIELATLLWGSAFLLLLLYAFAGNHIYRLIIRAFLLKTLDAVDCKLPDRSLFPGHSGIAEIKVELPQAALPGFQVRFIHSLRWHDRPSVDLETLLKPGRNTEVVEFIPRKRGHYQSRNACLAVRDMLGFTRGLIRIRLDEQVKVYPSLLPVEEWVNRMEQGGDEAEHLKKRQRSEEFVEIRKYFPGDDLRKINWKVFAHLGELLIRIGEETPPPESRFLVILDAAPGSSVPEELAGDYLDGLVEACASVMNLFLLKGLQIMFSTNGGGPFKTFSLEKRREMFSLLSGIWWADREALELPQKKAMQVIVFSSPGSASLERIVTSLRSRDWNVSIYLKELRYELPAQRKKSLKTFLFLPEEQAERNHQNRRSREKRIAFFKESLAGEKVKYRNPPWSLKNVGEI